MELTVSPGTPAPLGATVQPDGSVNFAVFSEHGTEVDLCLFDNENSHIEIARIRLPRRTGSFYHGAIRGIRAGQLYGFRVYGPWEPKNGHFFNPNKLLLDPYARAIAGRTAWHSSMASVTSDFLPIRTDSARHLTKSVVVHDNFDWEDDELLHSPLCDSVIYETHVKSLSKQHPGVPEHLRGTYLGLCSEPIIKHLNEIGVTAVQLLPIHHHLDDGFLLDRNLVNHWGYNTVGFFAPDSRYSSSGDRGHQVTEFKTMVKRLHQAGIEVILDVVYNHTGESGINGPTCMFRGFDNLAYYRTSSKGRDEYYDVTGCGNSVDIRHPNVLKLVMDSLRFWVEEFHVDGFRFDLAVTLGRDPAGFNPRATLFKCINLDPVLSRVKMIAEPWDIGRGGYQVGAFPEGWCELNGKYRDNIRRFVTGTPRTLAEFATRITGSEDLFAYNRRPPGASVNFITSHDGFTLRDLVSYNEKHNEANHEGNRDGDSHNLSWNHGVEGETDDPAIRRLRDRQRRNFMAILFLSQGVPFINAGDEIGRTQRGNNNAYCQDSEISWLDWSVRAEDQDLFEFVRMMSDFRRAHPVLRKQRFFSGRSIHGLPLCDMIWYTPEGEIMDQAHWHADKPGAVTVFLNRHAAEFHTEQSDSLLILFNAGPKPMIFNLPGTMIERWQPVIDTNFPRGVPPEKSRSAGEAGGSTVPVEGRSIQVWLLSEGDLLDAVTPCR